MSNSFTKGSWDLHVHCYPSVFPRWGDGEDLVEACNNAGMRGVVLKAHHGSTIEYAYALNKKEKSFNVFGGLTLNYFVGGLNPYAVDTATKLGAKIIWMPTIHAQNHKNSLGSLGGFSFQKPTNEVVPKKGISLIHSNGRLKKETRQILDILNNKNIVLATGHISTKEIAALIRYIKENNTKLNLLITHAFFHAPGLNTEDIKKLKRDRVWFEVDFHSTLDHVNSSTIKRVAKRIKEHDDAKWILSSDSGQKGNPKSPEAISLFAEKLFEAGVGEDKIREMCVKNPESILSV